MINKPFTGINKSIRDFRRIFIHENDNYSQVVAKISKFLDAIGNLNRVKTGAGIPIAHFTEQLQVAIIVDAFSGVVCCPTTGLAR